MPPPGRTGPARGRQSRSALASVAGTSVGLIAGPSMIPRERAARSAPGSPHAAAPGLPSRRQRLARRPNATAERRRSATRVAVGETRPQAPGLVADMITDLSIAARAGNDPALASTSSVRVTHPCPRLIRALLERALVDVAVPDVCERCRPGRSARTQAGSSPAGAWKGRRRRSGVL